jgi:hypothetical protein
MSSGKKSVVKREVKRQKDDSPLVMGHVRAAQWGVQRAVQRLVK